jgi:hypothetical protein
MWRASRRSLVPSWLADPLWSSVRARARKTTDPALARLPRCYIRACAERCEFGSATRWLSKVGKDGQSRRTNHWSGRVDSNHRPPGPELSKRRVMIGDDCFRSETQTSAGKGINVEMRPAFPQPSNCIANAPRASFPTSCVTIHVTIQSGRRPTAAFSPAAHSPCPQLHAMEGRLAPRMTALQTFRPIKLPRHPPCGKKTPLRSWPTSANELVEVFAGSETNSK